jgi:hypothetical protein
MGDGGWDGILRLQAMGNVEMRIDRGKMMKDDGTYACSVTNVRCIVDADADADAGSAGCWLALGLARLGVHKTRVNANRRSFTLPSVCWLLWVIQ